MKFSLYYFFSFLFIIFLGTPLETRFSPHLFFLFLHPLSPR
ncbi:hypothetical protein HMPREF9520_01712 [Enterococcus faecalis TX1467]|nr:hypothetical protein HMPREF9520_01712 [Enterococcus faecalis TX1467]